jgi:uncharacterized protein (DUF1778 family)
MNIKEKMTDFMMGKLTPEEKSAMMDQMMNKFFADIQPGDKQKMMEGMMEKFMSNMTPDDKQAMMQTMMPKMMGSMMGGGTGSPMMNMMSMMMGGKGPMNMMKSMKGDGNHSEEITEMPWDMCKKMMSTMSKTSELATFATPEVRELFEEWAAQIEEEILSFVKESQINNAEKIAEHFKLSRNSVTFFLTRLANKGKINLNAQKAE